MNSCNCNQGKSHCVCAIEQDLPVNKWTLAIAVAAVAAAAVVSHFFPAGFAQF